MGEKVGGPSQRDVRSRLTAFGLAVVSEFPILGAVPDVADGLPETRLQHVGATDTGIQVGGETVLERRWKDGSLAMRVRRLPDDGFAVDAPGHGEFEIAPAGDAVLTRNLQGSPARWHRPLLGQVLPLASTLAGHETLHASAVVIDGGAVAVTAPSNMGKSSLMFNLVDRGAGLLTDDVVALTPCGGALIAHPGSPLANLSAEQYTMLTQPTRDRLGSPVAEAEKLTFAVSGLRGRSAPLRALVALRRSERCSHLEISRVPAPDPIELLAATFLPHVMTQMRMRRQLDVCAQIARTVPVLLLQAPASVPARELARVVEDAVDVQAPSPAPPGSCVSRRPVGRRSRGARR